MPPSENYHQSRNTNDPTKAKQSQFEIQFRFSTMKPCRTFYTSGPYCNGSKEPRDQKEQTEIVIPQLRNRLYVRNGGYHKTQSPNNRGNGSERRFNLHFRSFGWTSMDTFLFAPATGVSSFRLYDWNDKILCLNCRCFCGAYVLPDGSEKEITKVARLHSCWNAGKRKEGAFHPKVTQMQDVTTPP
jgi:hypothetical protein